MPPPPKRRRGRPRYTDTRETRIVPKNPYIYTEYKNINDRFKISAVAHTVDQKLNYVSNALVPKFKVSFFFSSGVSRAVLSRVLRGFLRHVSRGVSLVASRGVSRGVFCGVLAFCTASRAGVRRIARMHCVSSGKKGAPFFCASFECAFFWSHSGRPVN